MNENPTNADEQNELGDNFYFGRGTEKDREKAAYWYTKASKQGHVEAQYCLGDLYSRGEGVPNDFVKAAYWYTKAAEQGHTGAQHNLGVIFYNGDAAPRDLEKAKYWFTKATEHGDITGAKDMIEKINRLKAETSSNSENNLFIYSVIGAILLGAIFATAGFIGFVIGAIAGWFIGKKIGEKILERKQ